MTLHKRAGEDTAGLHSAGIDEFPNEEPDTRVVNEAADPDNETWTWDGQRWTKED